MSDKNYSIEIVKMVYPSLRLVRVQDTNGVTSTDGCVIYRLSLEGGGERVELELNLSYSKIRVASLFPYYGILSHAPFLTPGENPLNQGFMDGQGELTEKGAYFLLRVIKDVVNIYEIALCRPNAILGLYTMYFLALREKDPSLEFGKVELRTGSTLTKSLGRVVSKHCGFEVGWSVDLFHSLQSVTVNHPEIFRGNLN